MKAVAADYNTPEFLSGTLRRDHSMLYMPLVIFYNQCVERVDMIKCSGFGKDCSILDLLQKRKFCRKKMCL